MGRRDARDAARPALALAVDRRLRGLHLQLDHQRTEQLFHSIEPLQGQVVLTTTDEQHLEGLRPLLGHAPLKYAVAVLSVLPALGVPFAVLRYCQSMDELQLRIQLESLAFAFVAASIATFTYGFLQNAGLPDVSWVWVWPVMGLCWLVGQLVARRRYR